MLAKLGEPVLIDDAEAREQPITDDTKVDERVEATVVMRGPLGRRAFDAAGFFVMAPNR